MAAVELTDENFEKEIKNHKGVAIVDFWAEWCGPCKVIEPIFDEAAEEGKGSAKFGKLDVDKYAKTASEFNIMTIPTIIIFKDGEKKEQLAGVQDKATILRKIKEIGK